MEAIDKSKLGILPLADNVKKVLFEMLRFRKCLEDCKGITMKP